MRRALVLLGAGAALLVGCGGNPVEQFVDKQRKAFQTICRCESIRTTATAEECIANADLPTDAEVDCGKAWYDRNKAAAEAATQCAVDVMDDFERCVRNATCNAVAVQNCLNAFLNGIDLCPDLPSAVGAELDACDIFAGD